WVTSTTATASVLAMLADAGLRHEVDRVAAAVGMRVIYVAAATSGESPLTRKTWSAAAAVLLDEAAALRCRQAGLPRRAHVVVLVDTEPTPATWAAALTVGAQHVLTLPSQERDLIDHLAEAAQPTREDGHRGNVVAVIGGRGGAGA